MEFSRLIEEPGVVLFPDQFDIAAPSVSPLGDGYVGPSCTFESFGGLQLGLFAVVH